MKCVDCTILMLWLTLAIGCRSQQPPPALVPETTVERLVEPPPGTYDKVGFRPEAMQKTYNPNGLGDAPRSLVPTSGFGSRSNGNSGPYKF